MISITKNSSNSVVASFVLVKKCLALLGLEFCIMCMYLRREAVKRALSVCFQVYACKCLLPREKTERVREERRGVKCNLIWCVCLINSRLSVLAALRETQNTLSHTHTCIQ
jgi:hypothetical protein